MLLRVVDTSSAVQTPQVKLVSWAGSNGGSGSGAGNCDSSSVMTFRGISTGCCWGRPVRRHISAVTCSPWFWLLTLVVQGADSVESSDVSAWFLQWPICFGRQVLHFLDDLTHTQFVHLPDLLHLQQDIWESLQVVVITSALSKNVSRSNSRLNDQNIHQKRHFFCTVYSQVYACTNYCGTHIMNDDFQNFNFMRPQFTDFAVYFLLHTKYVSTPGLRCHWTFSMLLIR